MIRVPVTDLPQSLELVPGITITIDWSKVIGLHGDPLILGPGQWQVRMDIVAEPFPPPFVSDRYARTEKQSSVIMSLRVAP